MTFVYGPIFQQLRICPLNEVTELIKQNVNGTAISQGNESLHKDSVKMAKMLALPLRGVIIK